jgi:hypothetical protein
VGRHVDRLQFFDVLLGNQPVLTPPQLVYQRMLAGDPIEASQQAHTHLEGASLEDYYDTILLSGLRLAEADARLGRLDGERIERVLTTVREVVDDLETHQDRPLGDAPAADLRSDPARLNPAADVEASTVQLLEKWRQPGAIMCIPGSGKLDEAAALVIVQMLHRRGLGAVAETADAMSISRFFSLDLSQVSAFCICYVGKPSNAMIQYRVRRLSKKSKGGRIFIALLGDESETVTPRTRDITPVNGNFGGIVDFIAEAAVEDSRTTNRAESARQQAIAPASV